MQKPDKDGYVNVIWPSRTIPHGGIFHARRSEPTQQQQEFLKVLQEESKLTLAQRKKSAFKLRQEEEPKPEPEVHMPLVRPRTSKRRSLSAIRESGIFELDPYKPTKRGEDREKLKDQLANAMAYGDTPEQTPPPPPRIPKPAPKLPNDKDKWNDLLTQIRERAEWLAEMEDLGHAEPHREIIKEQIAERMRALEALDISSPCSSVRSAFSTTRSREPVPSVRSNASVKSKESQGVKASKPKKGSPKPVPETRRSSLQERQATAQSSEKKIEKIMREENVAAYGQFSPLQYSPRRRV